jgi:hypothetical protein
VHDPDTLAAMMEAAAKAQGLTLPEGSRAAILVWMAEILEQARICEESLGGETVEIAPVFRP